MQAVVTTDLSVFPPGEKYGPCLPAAPALALTVQAEDRLLALALALRMALGGEPVLMALAIAALTFGVAVRHDPKIVA